MNQSEVSSKRQIRVLLDSFIKLHVVQRDGLLILNCAEYLYLIASLIL